MFNRPMRGQAGFTIIEAMISAAVMTIVILMALQGWFYAQKAGKHATTGNSSDNRMNEIIQTIRNNVSQQIISFPMTVDSVGNVTASDAINKAYIASKLNPSALPMAWSLATDEPVAGCPTCPGRYGYVIVPLVGYAGVYEVTIVFTYTEWANPKNYSFLVTR